MSQRKVNIAGHLAEIFVTSKLTLLFMLACAVLGMLAILLTPREENPQIIVPGAQVRVLLPGASAVEVEQLVIRPLEDIVKQVPGVDHTFATSMNSVGFLTVQFEVGQDKEKSLVKLYDRILSQRDRLPADASAPLIVSVDVDDVPIVTVTLASQTYDDYALKRLADRLLDGLRSLESVSATYIKGGRDREVRVELEPDSLEAFAVTVDQVRAFLTTANVSAPLGSVVQQGHNRSVFLDGYLTSEDDLKQLIVGSHAGRPIYLDDVAVIVDGPAEERTQLSRFTFGPADPRFGKSSDPEMPAVALAVAKKPGTNAVVVADEVLARIERMRQQFIPAGVELVVTRNDGQKADAAVNVLIEHLGIAVFSVFLVMVLFLGLKEALIVGLSVPLILGLTLGVNYLFGPTINRLTLFALILSLGLLVDAAIVVIENIHRRYAHLGRRDKRAVTVQATNEIGSPTNLATIAVMLVFISLMMVTGMLGQYFYPIAFTVPVAMLASLLVAYTITPWAANRWLQPGEGHDLEDHNSKDRLHRFYHALMTPLIDRPRLRRGVLLGVATAILLSLLQPAWQFMRPAGISGAQSWLGVEMAMLPKDNKNTFNIALAMPESSPLETTDRVVREIGAVLRQNTFILNYQSWLGEAGVVDFNGLLRGTGNKTGPHIAEIRVNLIDKTRRSTTSIEIVRDLRQSLLAIQSRYPGSVIQLLEDSPGPPVRAMVMAEIYGSDLAQLRAIGKQVEEAFRATYDMVEVNDSEPDDVPEYRLVVDREKAALSGVTTAEVAIALRRLLDGEELGRVHIAGEKNAVPIRLKIPRRHQIDPALLSRIHLAGREGKSVPLSGLVRIESTLTERPIQHKDGERVLYVGGELVSTAPVFAVLDLDRRLDGLLLANDERLGTGNLRLTPAVPDTIDGYHLLWDGEIRMTLDTYRDMLGALGLALTLIYLMLVAYYQSFAIPLVAMAAIPLGLVGIFPGHWLMGQSFTATSLIGVIALAGVVVRNSLLIIDFVLDYRHQGMSLRKAILEAGAVRLRPILLTALAIIFGSMIMLSDPVFGGLAISLIFGTLSATILTLIVVPILLYRLLRPHSPSESATV
ncbi:efflux RND transporter permease subunit [Pseudomonas turukhanskensis]|jgi:multidrug efflux pump subunit AcrB|uniref:Multidrug transporter AcrB n=1 Tax=Pseudomonas turukhanskensis TaxID=1806536 RepID=A0A9W6NH93_9PSED|nr:efflux RND transporter permease subunit [Pseudomonas turukhanskensis]GLK90883.1 multidrug transporter AcrB [Pseudomonas turukhanskensis]